MKRVLSIDGGGIRGLIPALVLAEIEERTGKAIANSFDLIAGTSTGGILALGLARDSGDGKPKYKAKDLAGIYQKRGGDIFSRTRLKEVSSLGGIRDEKFSKEGIEKVLHEYFGEDTLGSALTNTLITSYDIQNREPLFLKSWREDHSAVRMKIAARATSAAPTFFEPALVPIGGAVKALVDGGIFINSPVVSAYVEAKKIFGSEEEIFVLSIGTGELNRPFSYDKAKNWGKAEWIVPLLSCVFDGVSDAANYQMKTLLDDNFIRLQTDLSIASDDMDDTSSTNMENMKLQARQLIDASKNQIEKICKFLTA